MERYLGKYSEPLYALLRFITGFLFTCHGAQKVFGVLGGSKAAEPLMVAGGWIELVCGLLVAVGLFAGFAAFLASGEMAVAYFMAHAKGGFWPIQNHGELAVLYCFVFLYIASRGSGGFSADAARGKAR